MSKNRFRLYFFLVLCSFSIAYLACNFNSEEKSDSPYLNVSEEAQYIGKAQCAKCHGEIAESFSHTGMGLSFDKASLNKTSAEFNAESIIHDSSTGLSYHPQWTNGKLSVKEYMAKDGNTLFERDQNIDFIIGSGQHTNSHLFLQNGHLFQAPFTFYTQKGHWDLPPGFELGNNSRFSRKIMLECLSCHNAYPDPVIGSDNMFSKIPNGIDCERCHGPGSIHAKQKSEGKVINTAKEIDYSIVNPAKLSVNLQFEICQRCHLQGNAVLQPGKSFLDFKPSTVLNKVMDVYAPVYRGHEDEFIMASHVERLKMSKCFVKTMEKVNSPNFKPEDPQRPYKSALTCVTCHNPHVSVRNTSTDKFNSACQSCHGKHAGEKICTKSSDLTNTNNCVSCHMPKSGTIDIPHVSTHDHYIRKPVTKQELQKIKLFLGIKAINNPNPTAYSRAKGYLNYFEKYQGEATSLDSAKYWIDKLDNEEFKVFELEVQLKFLKQDWLSLVQIAKKMGEREVKANMAATYDNQNVWTAYRISEAFRQEGQLAEALKYIEMAVNTAPKITDFLLKKAQIEFESSAFDKALTSYTKVVEEEPTHAVAWNSIGLIQWNIKHDLSKATIAFEKAIAGDGLHKNAYLNLIKVLDIQGRKIESEKVLKKLNQIWP